jgi:AraC-like DNA-binding protein
VNRARDYLHAHLASKISLGDVAAAACLSPFNLRRVFQTAFGQSPEQNSKIRKVYLSGAR